MAKRIKRVEKGIESIKGEIEKHFDKIEEDINLGNLDRGRYHLKEIDKSLLKALEAKIEFLGIEDHSAQDYRKRLEKMKKDLEENYLL